jgi:hypothetical protein
MAPTIADMIRSKLDAGVLPREATSSCGPSFGSCRPCGRTILPQAEHELEFADGRLLHMHVGCAGLYEAERRRRGWSGSPGG